MIKIVEQYASNNCIELEHITQIQLEIKKIPWYVQAQLGVHSVRVSHIVASSVTLNAQPSLAEPFTVPLSLPLQIGAYWHFEAWLFSGVPRLNQSICAGLQ